jgi:hypothetical protein
MTLGSKLVPYLPTASEYSSQVKMDMLTSCLPSTLVIEAKISNSILGALRPSKT